ncbi:MAG TPA: nucleoside deaminase [Patescibacteria group bacterium]|nr:nucleoside deaminase [Patescibacteria group bacterium]
MSDEDIKFLRLSIEQAKKSVNEGGFPAGAIIVKDGKIVSEAISTGFIHNDPSGHAETVAIREACKSLNTANLEGATLYESVECCVMCFSVAYWAGISKIVYACKKTPEMASKHYYEGTTDNQAINKVNNRQIDLVFASEYEQESLKVIQEWEAQGGFNKK